jgi:hypothetical protein
VGTVSPVAGQRNLTITAQFNRVGASGGRNASREFHPGGVIIAALVRDQCLHLSLAASVEAHCRCAGSFHRGASADVTTVTVPGGEDSCVFVFTGRAARPPVTLRAQIHA